jgi:hypothetical protein
MANWWDSAPLVEQPKSNWWEAAPLAARGHSNVPEFDPGVEGYNPETGLVERPKTSGASSFLSGAADTAGVGFGDEIASTLVAPFTDRTRDEVLAQMRQNQRRAQADNPGAFLSGQVGGGLAQAAALGPASLAARGQTLVRVATGSAADGTILGGLYGAGSGETPEERVSGLRVGAIGGGIVGGAAPLAISGAGNMVRRAVSPVGISGERQAAAQTLAREGVETTAGQRTGSSRLRYMESEIGGAKAENIVERQSEQFTAAALRRAGIDANRATPDVIDGAFTQISNQFERLGSRNTLVPDQQMLGDIQSVVNDYRAIAAQPIPAVDNFVSAISSMLKQTGIPGKTYQSLRSQIDRYARKAPPEAASALRGLKDALDDTMERGLAASGSPDLGEWRAVRGAYRNMLALEQAATGAGENAAAGLISPSALRNAVVSKQGRRNYARGKGDFDELARAGEMLMKALPNSGTAGRLRAQNLSAGILAGGGALAGGLPGMIAGMVAPRVAGAALMSRPVQHYLSNNTMAGQMPLEGLAGLARLATGAGAPHGQELLPWR